LDIDKELVKLNDANQKLIDERSNKKKKDEKEEEKQTNTNNVEEYITIDDFEKIQLKLGKIIDCENHPKADKLLVLKIKIGEETRTVVSGIRKWYNPEDLIGKNVVVAYNLKPVKLRGIESKGMILAAQDSTGNLSLLTTLEELEDGASIS
jgi:methionyl-tRNA synthetase